MNASILVPGGVTSTCTLTVSTTRCLPAGTAIAGDPVSPKISSGSPRTTLVALSALMAFAALAALVALADVALGMKSLVFTAANEMAGAYHMTGRFGCAQKNFRQLRRGHH